MHSKVYKRMAKVLTGSSSRKYVLEKVIGQGSFGKVYLSGEYAVKEISLDVPAYLRTSMQTEIKIMRSFNHPNIVSLIDVIYEGKYVYIVMEYCVMDLAKYIKTNKIDEVRAKKILKQIISGFSQLHEKGITHRDLKPANILVNSKGEFKLADFGFAKYVDYDSKLLFSIVGTPLYMAPQILNKKEYTTKCDIWSIGFIYFELVTSKLPWTGTSETDLYRNIMKKPLIIPEYVSEWSSTLLKKMLVASESDRIGWDELIKYVLTSEKGTFWNKFREQFITKLRKVDQPSKEAEPRTEIPEYLEHFQLNFGQILGLTFAVLVITVIVLSGGTGPFYGQRQELQVFD